ncbi:MAG TPA: rhomboid family intramembrane serine protease [Solirubrobacteraceae bacterium]|nr:rhomboid family intramembrane serine protease [Solirubrobacteraceae bacterium]
MTSGADLFVVCKQCGSEVSPYITECPYCGNRLRRRAPKLPRVNGPKRPAAGRARLGSLLGAPGRGVSGTRARARRTTHGAGRWAASRPYATIALVAVSCVSWIVFHAELKIYTHMAIVGPIAGDWWKPFTSEFASLNGPYTFVAILTLAIFGWLLEDRHGPAVVLALFFAAGAAGALVADAAYKIPLANGANGAALALLACWAAPDIRAARAGAYYEGDLLGAGALAALLLAMPFAAVLSEASWLAGVVGAAIGLLVGLGLSRTDDAVE